MAAKQKVTYRVILPDGTVATRTSTRHYLYVVVAYYPETTEPGWVQYDAPVDPHPDYPHVEVERLGNRWRRYEPYTKPGHWVDFRWSATLRNAEAGRREAISRGYRDVQIKLV